MSEVQRFITVDLDDRESDEYATREAAAQAAKKLGHALAMRTYIYDDTELVWTPDGSNFWPPKFTKNDRLGRNPNPAPAKEN